MARQLQATHLPSSTSQLGLAGASLFLCAFALFMCASHMRKWRRRWNACLEYDYEYDDPVIELNQETVVATTQGVETRVEARDRDKSIMFSGEQQPCVWKKNILMGGKCQLPDFSGVIIYDNDGNVVAPAKTPRPLLNWK